MSLFVLLTSMLYHIRSFVCYVNTCYLSYFSFSIACANAHYVEPVETSPGIYFDPVGSLTVIDSYLNILIPVDITFVASSLENINSILGTSRYLCKQGDIFKELECDNILLPLVTRYSDLSNEFDSISHILDPKRFKRVAWFSAIGTVFKHLFGSMDENDAIKYSEAISSVQNDQKKLAVYMKDNILVTNSLLKSYKDLARKIDANQAAIEDSVNSINRILINITTNSDKTEFRSKFNELVNILESNILSISFKLEDIINSIMFSKVNIIYPAVITPKQLFSELVENYRLLPSSRVLPTSLTLDNINIILNISDVSSYYIDHKIVFVIRLPLVTPDEYNLYRCIPFPIPYDKSNPNSFTTIIPSVKFVGITKDEQYYCKLDSLHQCKTIYNNYICNIPNSYSTSDNSICEINLLTRISSNIPTSCQTKIFQGKIEIIKNLNNNKWLYVGSDKSKINIQCNKSDTSEPISGTSIITLPSECKAFIKNTVFTPKQNILINLKPIIPKSNILNNTCCDFIQYKNVEPTLPNLTLLNVDFDDVNNLDNSDRTIQNLNEIITKPNTILHYSISVTSIFVILIIIITLTCSLAYKFNILCFKPVPIPPTPENPVEDPEPALPRIRIS